MEVLQGTALMAATITMGIGAGVYLLYFFAIMNRTGFRGDSALTRPAWAWPALECTPSRSPRD